MFNRGALVALLLLSLWIPVAYPPTAHAQQTLGGITGTVTDKTGSVLPETAVTIVGDQTKLTRTQKTNPDGIYDFVNLPIGIAAAVPTTWSVQQRRFSRCVSLEGSS